MLERVLLFVVGPVWLLAGSLDGACHRFLKIEQSTGVRESLLHLAMLFELAIGALAALLLELNAAAFLIMLMAAVLHEATMWCDLAYAEKHRRVPWFEQLVHGTQQVLPWVALGALALLHPAQALSVFGVGEVQADWRLMLKQPPLPLSYLLTFIGAALLAVVWPFVNEFLICLRAAKTGRSLSR